MTTASDRTAFSVRMPEEHYEALRTYSHFTNTPMNEVIVKAVATFLQDTGRRELIESAASRAQEQYRTLLDKLKDL